MNPSFSGQNRGRTPPPPPDTQAEPTRSVVFCQPGGGPHQFFGLTVGEDPPACLNAAMSSCHKLPSIAQLALPGPQFVGLSYSTLLFYTTTYHHTHPTTINQTRKFFQPPRSFPQMRPRERHSRVSAITPALATALPRRPKRSSGTCRPRCTNSWRCWCRSSSERFFFKEGTGRVPSGRSSRNRPKQVATSW